MTHKELRELCDKAEALYVGPEYSRLRNEFVITARNVIPELLDEIERLKKELDDSKGLLQSTSSMKLSW